MRAEVASLPNLSAHADYAEIVPCLGNFAQPPQQVFVTRAELVAADALRHRFEERLKWACRVPGYLESYALTRE